MGNMRVPDRMKPPCMLQCALETPSAEWQAGGKNGKPAAHITQPWLISCKSFLLN